jgi:hypothetical protein
MEWRQKMIQEVFGGDEKRFEKAYDEAVEDGIQDAVSWRDVVLNATVLPHLEDQAKDLIEVRLGYLPPSSITLRYEYELRTLLQNFNLGKINLDNFYHQADRYIKLIRNDDIEPNNCLTYEPYLYEKYRKEFLPYGQMAKGRIMGFLGYEPRLEYSLAAEIWLSSILAKDYLKLPNKITPIDFRAISIIKYREILLSHGKEVADNSPLLYCGLIE